MPLKILFVVPYVPDLIRVRPYNLIRHLAERGNQVMVVAPWTNEEEHEKLQQLRGPGVDVAGVDLPTWRSYWNCLLAVPTTTPLQSVYCWHPALMQTVTTLLADHAEKSFDVVHVEHLRGARYGLKLLQELADSAVPVVWDSVDSISYLFRQTVDRNPQGLRRILTQFELQRTEWYEGYLVNSFDHVLVTSKTDKKALEELGHLAAPAADKVAVLNNGVDLAYFMPEPGLQREPATLVVSGKLSYHANVSMVLHLAQNVMPLVWAERPEVKLCVVGKNPPREILALGENPAVMVTGTVPDIRPYLQQATVAVAPITYGAGIQNKVLEAMACGTPVVATSKAVSALDILPGEDVLVADDVQQLARAVLQLLSSRDLQKKIGDAGRRYVEKHHSWKSIAEKLEAVYWEAVIKKRGKYL